MRFRYSAKEQEHYDISFVLLYLAVHWEKKSNDFIARSLKFIPSLFKANPTFV